MAHLSSFMPSSLGGDCRYILVVSSPPSVRRRLQVGVTNPRLLVVFFVVRGVVVNIVVILATWSSSIRRTLFSSFNCLLTSWPGRHQCQFIVVSIVLIVVAVVVCASWSSSGRRVPRLLVVVFRRGRRGRLRAVGVRIVVVMAWSASSSALPASSSSCRRTRRRPCRSHLVGVFIVF